MELDDLKAPWRKDTVLHEQLNKKNMEQLQFIVQGKTTNLARTLKRKFEKIINSLMIGILIFTVFFMSISDGFAEPGTIKGFIKGLLVYMAVLIFYWIRFKSINNLALSDDLKVRLRQLIQKLRKNLKLEVIFFFVTYLIAIVAGRFILGKGMEDILKPDVVITFALSVLFIGTILLLTTRRYKRQIAELQGYLEEYEESIEE